MLDGLSVRAVEGCGETTDETGKRETPSSDGRGLTFVLLRAVAVGFEPTVKLPPHTLSRSAPGFWGRFSMIHGCLSAFISAGQRRCSRGRGHPRIWANHGG